jgi:hypothetical protein
MPGDFWSKVMNFLQFYSLVWALAAPNVCRSFDEFDIEDLYNQKRHGNA